MKPVARSLAAVVVSLVLNSCAPSSAPVDSSIDASADAGREAAVGGDGVIDVRIWGENYVRNAIPALDFADEWRVEFSRFLLHVSNVRFASAQYEGVLEPEARVVDVKRLSAPTTLGLISNAQTGRLDRVQFEFSRAGDSSSTGNASEADLALMKSNGYSLYVEGTATHATRGAFTFRWGFSNATRFAGCVGAQRMPGIVVQPAPATTTAQLTLHADHLFLDGIENADAALRFDAIAAADRDGDRVITLDELAMVSMSSLPMGQYQVGSAGNISTLRDFVTALTATMGHLNGDGQCAATRL